MTGPTILCLSRSYLSRLMPAIAKQHADATYLHIVQNKSEEAYVRSQGQEVVLNIQRVVDDALRKRGVAAWREPADFRQTTGFPWSAVYSDRYLPSFAPDIRLKIAGALFEALEEIFTSRTIDAFLSEPVALFITHVIFYLCRIHGARRLMWANSYFPGHFYFVDDVNISKPIRAQPMADEEAAELERAIAAYVDGVAQDKRGPAYHPSFVARKLSALTYFKQRKGQEPLVLRAGLKSKAIQFARLMRARAARASFPRHSDFITAGAIDEHRFYLRALRARQSIYDSVPATFDARNVVFPLQFEPEASLLYFAPDFRDQLVYVEAALRALPMGHVLWVKEHPNQFGALGERPWRLLRQRYDNLRLVHGRQNGRQLIGNAGLVMSISSSAGMDALILGRRTIVAGQVFYRNYTGALPISSTAELADLLNDPCSYLPVDNRSAIIAELSAFGKSCYAGDPQPAHQLFDEANIANLVSAIAAECSAPSSARLAINT